MAQDFQFSQVGCHKGPVLPKLSAHLNLQSFLSCFFENKVSVGIKKFVNETVNLWGCYSLGIKYYKLCIL